MAKDKNKKAVKAAAAPVPVKAAEAKPASSLKACACSRFHVLVNLRNENEDGSGDLTWDDELTTGCGGGKTKATFLPGHDAKLKSALIRWGVEGYDITEDTGGVNLLGDALQHAAKFGFHYMVAEGIKRGTAKLAEKADKATARAAKKAAAAKPAKKAAAKKPEPEATPAVPLADIVAAEQQAHEEAEARKVAEREGSADWSDDDNTPAEVIVAGLKPDEKAVAEALGETAPSQTAEAVCEMTGNAEVLGKVGRWEYKGVMCDNGHFHYLAKDGHTRKQAEPGKFEIRAEI